MNYYINKIREFMYGRNGLDDLGRVTIGAYIVIAVLKIIMPCTLVDALSLICAVIFIYRFFSKNIYKRQLENRKYLDIKSKFFSWYDAGNRNSSMRRKYIFKNCPHCGAKLRLPRKRGKHVCNCPRCYKDFDVRVW